MSQPVPPETIPSSSGTPEPRGEAEIGRGLADFLLELATGLQKRAMYPDGHPMLVATVERLLARLEVLLQERPSLAIGVGRQRLMVEGTATPPGHAVFRELAGRLHRHRIASLRVARGVTGEQLGGLLQRLAIEPTRGQRPLGLSLDTLPGWDAIVVKPMSYDRLGLKTEAEGEAAKSDRSGPETLWLELARLSLGGDDTAEAAEAAEAGELRRLAQGIARQAGSDEYGGLMLSHLTRVAESLRESGESVDFDLRTRVSELITLLEPGALARILEHSGGASERARFAQVAALTLAADAVIEVVDAAAAASRRTLSPHLLRLLRKLGQLAEAGSEAARPEADGALRKNVARLLTDWHLDDPNPTQYTGVLEAMAYGGAGGEPEVEEGWDPEVVLCVSLEIGEAGERAGEAAAAMVRAGRLADAVTLLAQAPRPDRVAELWSVLATPDNLRLTLTRNEFESEVAQHLIDHLGAAAADPLLEILAESEDRSARAAALRALGRLGPPAAARAVALLPRSPWYVQRNLLVLLGRTGAWPDGFTPEPYAAHGDPRVRREAIKLLLEVPDTRNEGLAHGLTDADAGISALALGTALEHCPAPLLPVIDQIARDGSRPPAHRVLAIRVLARSGTGRALDVLIGIALIRSRWLLWHRLAPKSPEVLAAIAGLASRWSEDPRAAEVLSRAGRHSDPEIRAASRRG